MPKSIDVLGNYAYFGPQNPPQGFLRNAISRQHVPVAIRSDCNLVPGETVIIDGATHIKTIECRADNCPSEICIFNRK